MLESPKSAIFTFMEGSRSKLSRQYDDISLLFENAITTIDYTCLHSLLFWFQVSVNNLVAMAVFDSTHNLLKKASCLVF